MGDKRKKKTRMHTQKDGDEKERNPLLSSRKSNTAIVTIFKYLNFQAIWPIICTALVFKPSKPS